MSVPLFGQAPAFEVASVKLDGPRFVNPSPDRGIDTAKWCELSDTRFTCDLLMGDLLEETFGLEPWKIVGPDWRYKGDKIKVEAVTPPGTTLEAAKRMLPSLLAERFGLVFHYEHRTVPVYALVQGKGGAKVTPFKGWEKARTIEGVPSDIGKSSIVFAHDRIESVAFSMKYLALNLSFRADRPVIDATGLEGDDEFKVRWDFQPDKAANDREMLDALQRQLNLKLEKREVSYDFLVIDRLEKLPTAN